MQFLTNGPNGWSLTVKYLHFHRKLDDNLNLKNPYQTLVKQCYWEGR